MAGLNHYISTQSYRTDLRDSLWNMLQGWDWEPEEGQECLLFKDDGWHLFQYDGTQWHDLDSDPFR